MAAGGGPAEAQHRTEAREEQHLIELMTQIHASWTGENLVANHLAVLVHGDIEEQTVGKRELRVVLLRSPGLRDSPKA